MWFQIICLCLTINSLSLFSDANPLGECNVTSLFTSINSQLAVVRTEVERLKTDGLVKESDYQAFRAEQERQGKLIEGLVDKLDLLESRFNPINCTEAKWNGIYNVLLPNYSRQPFEVACDAITREGGWTILLRRFDGSVEFNRSWTEYKNGFGELSGEFFLGLDKIHELTAERRQELLIILEDFEGRVSPVTYDEFAIGDEKQQYVLHSLGEAHGIAGDALSNYKGMQFSTFDRDNDLWPANCAKELTGGWWYRSCGGSHLTGKYRDNTRGIFWSYFGGFAYSLKRAIMMIRPKK
ncbi:microfibril-associated glycoprotein 4-like [Drosophila innubila]|uniref:microfibril-associated glycoprotein 4-like n=1 Tax=Drosophila innubila TaxID=198719 RepID=UPI00148DB6AF|nr:microfibril-associated glycoprotein 4-like [Drosophila innubila]